MLMGIGNEFQWNPTIKNKFITKFQWSLGWMLRSVITCNGNSLVAMGLLLTWWSELIVWNGNTWLSSSSAKLTPISCLTNRTLKWVSASYCTINSQPISLEPVLAFHAVSRISLKKRKRAARAWHNYRHYRHKIQITLAWLQEIELVLVFTMASANRLSLLTVTHHNYNCSDSMVNLRFELDLRGALKTLQSWHFYGAKQES